MHKSAPNLTPTAVATAPELDSLLIDKINGEYDFTYNSPGSGITYKLFNIASPDGGIGSYVANLTGTSTSISSGSFNLNSQFAILATDSSGHGSLSAPIDAVFASAPGVAWGSDHNTLSAKLLSNTTVGLAWDNNAWNEDGTEIQISATGGPHDCDWTTLATVDPDITSYLATVAPNSTNYFRIRAVRDATVQEYKCVYNCETDEWTDETVSQHLDSPWIFISEPVTAPAPTIRMTISDGDGGHKLDHTQNLTQGGFVILNADEDDGLGLDSSDTPNVPDMYAFDLPHDDPDLKKITIETTGTVVGDKVAITWVNGVEPNGTGNIVFWQDPEKDTEEPSTVTLTAPNQTITFYVEGVALSSFLNDLTVKATVENNAGTAYQAGGVNVADELYMTVGPILESFSATKKDNAHLNYLDHEISSLPSNSYMGLSASARLDPASDPDNLHFIQTAHIANNASDETRTGGAVVESSDGNTFYTCDFASPNAGATLVDAEGAGQPTTEGFPFYSCVIRLGAAYLESFKGALSIFTTDSPSLSLDEINPVEPKKGEYTLIDVTYQFDDYVVWKYADGSILVLGHTTWSLTFHGTLVNNGGKITYNPATDEGFTNGSGFTLTTESIPIALVTPVGNDAGLGWRED